MSPEFLLTTLIVCLASGISVVCTLSVALGSGASLALERA